MKHIKKILILVFLLSIITCNHPPKDVYIASKVYVIERESGSLAVIDLRTMSLQKRIPLQETNLRHATMVFDPYLKYGYIATRNGRLNRIDLEKQEYAGFLETSKNSIGMAISQDGKTVAVSEYEPGGITFVDTDTFTITNVLPAKVEFNGKELQSKVTGLVDAGNNTFVCALMDANQIWLLGLENGKYVLKHKSETKTPYPFDALISPEGRYYITGHFKSNEASWVDLWNLTPNANQFIFQNKASDRSPTKMPHMEAWAVADEKVFVPVPGESKLHVIDRKSFQHIRSIDLISDPVYAVVHPNNKEIWVSFSGKDDGKIQIIDTRTEKTIQTLDVGKKIYHLVFTPKGDRALVSSNETNEFVIINALNYQTIQKIPLNSPSGIFGVWRAFQIGL